MERVEGRRRIIIDTDLMEEEKPLFEVVDREPSLNDGGQPMNMRENGRLLMSLGLDGEDQSNGNRFGKYLAFDSNEVTDVVVIEVLTDEAKTHYRGLYGITHLEADMGDSGILVFYNKREQ